MRFLICGLGSIGQRHLRNLLTLGQQDIVLLRTGKGKLPLREAEALPAEDDLAVALERWKPEAALVTNPTALHLEVAIPAARAGCHLFLEKPISHNLDRVDELREALREGGGKALVGFQFRYDPGLRSVRRLIHDGVMGTPLSGRVSYGDYLPDWHPWEDHRESYSARADLGGGALLTLCHPFDYLRWIVAEVTGVTARVAAGGPLGLKVESNAEVILEHAGEILASVHLDYHQRPPRHGLELVCSEGTIQWEAGSGVVRWWTAGSGAWQEQSPSSGYERNSLFLDEMRHFLEVVQGVAEPKCTLEDGVRALEIALAAHRSAVDGVRVAL